MVATLRPRKQVQKKEEEEEKKKKKVVVAKKEKTPAKPKATTKKKDATNNNKKKKGTAAETSAAAAPATNTTTTTTTTTATRVDQQSVLEEFLSKHASVGSPHESKTNDIKTLHNLIRKKAPILQVELQGNNDTTLAYGGFDYQTKSKCSGRWSRIGIMLNKTGLSLMVSGETKNGTYLLETCAKNYFGKKGVSVGKSCIRFQKLEDLNVDAIEELLEQAANADISSLAV